MPVDCPVRRPDGRRPRLLDLFCGAGGAAKGYQEAGFYVVGVDVRPQPNYCGDEFYQGDALSYLHSLSSFDAVHASCPCQASANVTSWRGDQANHPELIPETRELLEATGLPWVIENVPEAAIRHDFLLCGSMFGLPIRRHRAFETNWPAPVMRTPCWHKGTDLAFMHKGERAYADAMGCGWMTAVREGRQAIPPAFTAHVGAFLMAEVEARSLAAVSSSTTGGER